MPTVPQPVTSCLFSCTARIAGTHAYLPAFSNSWAPPSCSSELKFYHVFSNCWQVVLGWLPPRRKADSSHLFPSSTVSDHVRSRRSATGRLSTQLKLTIATTGLYPLRVSYSLALRHTAADSHSFQISLETDQTNLNLDDGPLPEDLRSFPHTYCP